MHTSLSSGSSSHMWTTSSRLSSLSRTRSPFPRQSSTSLTSWTSKQQTWASQILMCSTHGSPTGYALFKVQFITSCGCLHMGFTWLPEMFLSSSNKYSTRESKLGLCLLEVNVIKIHFKRTCASKMCILLIQ